MEPSHLEPPGAWYGNSPRCLFNTYSTHIHQWNSPDYIVAGIVLMLLVKKEMQQHFNLCFYVSLGELVSSTEEVVWHSLELYQYCCHLKYPSWIQFHMLLSKHCTFPLIVDQNVILDTNYCPVDMYQLFQI